MTSLYGRQWESSYGSVGEEAFKDWSIAFESMTPDQIKIGLDAVIDEGNEFPPNLIKFLRLCRQTTVAYHQAAKLPPPPKRKDPRAAEKCFKAARDLGVLK